MDKVIFLDIDGVLNNTASLSRRVHLDENRNYAT